jgi:TonB family protein
MIAYILECIVFQLIFLLGYELFLKKETFFEGNRLYLLGTFALSFVLPFLKIEAFSTVLPDIGFWNTTYVQRMDEVTVTAAANEGIFADLPWVTLVFISGMIGSLLFLMMKFSSINRLKKQGLKQHFSDYTKIIVSNSSAAFSFFRNIFIGDRIPQEFHGQIIAHEKVHMEQHHSLDLLFFEVMRIFNWFNPMVYVYQSRISELHEFIADSQVPKEERKQQYELLLSSVFDTQHISFINHFFQSSLIKKRIVMLKRSPSPGIWKFKYLLLVPVIALMLCYNSCKEESVDLSDNMMQVKDVENLSLQEEQELFAQLTSLSETHRKWNFTISDGNTSIYFSEADGDSYISGPNNEKVRAQMLIEGEVSKDFMSSFKGTDDPVPFNLVENVPVFPGCENSEDPRGCFNKQLQEHIRKNFNYPAEAVEQGIEGQVNLLFTIDEMGNVVDIKKRGPYELLENEADRIIRRLPQMKPGILKGSNVKVYYSIPIIFRLK